MLGGGRYSKKFYVTRTAVVEADVASRYYYYVRVVTFWGVDMILF